MNDCRLINPSVLALGFAFVACAATPQPTALPPAPAVRTPVVARSADLQPAAGSVFLKPSPLPYELPEFDKIHDDSFRPAFEAGIAEQRKEVEAIANNSEPPTFENTIVAFERSGRVLYRVVTTFFNLQTANTNSELDAIETEVAPKLAAHQDALLLNATLFARVKALHDRAASLQLDPESAQLLSRQYLSFVRAGANRSEAEKTRLKQVNAELSTLTTNFQQNVRKGTQDGALVFDDPAELDGASSEQLSAAASAAEARGLKGKWLVALQNTTTQPLLTSLTKRAQRERIYNASIARCNGGASDNTAVIAKIIRLRAERAALLGYENHAAVVLEDETAGTPAAVNKMLSELAPPSLAKAKREAAEIQALIDRQAKEKHEKSFPLAPWDWAFYAEQVRKARYQFDEAQTKPFFELNRVLQDGVFFAATRLYGITFKERHDLPTYKADVRTFEVFDADGSPLGLFLADYFARDNKQGGAWETQYVDQSQLLGTKPVVANHLNIPKPGAGQPALLTFDEVTTMFHEFGHALHALFSSVRYQSLSGTNTPPDFVEYPSQYNEMWATEPAVLANYARHYQTNAAMPQALLSKVLDASKFNQGFITSEYIAAAILDQSWHQLSLSQVNAAVPAPERVMPFEAAALKAAKVDFPAVPPRYHTPYFLHIFSSGYAAGYYAYLWSDVLARDTEKWMHDHGGLKRENGDLLRAKVLSRGRTAEPRTLFESFYGGPPDIKPLLEKRGLTLGKR
jgi:peptidyl-dipeptidase Dcp